MKEEWRDVPGFEGLYKIDISTPEGRCYSVCSQRFLSNNPNRRTKYINWELHDINGAYKKQQAARWIAITYPELVQNKYFEGADIDHIDTNRLNNHPTNLKWATRKENCNNPLTKEHYSKAKKGKRKARRKQQKQ